MNATTPAKPPAMITPEMLAAATDAVLFDWLTNGLPANADGTERKPMNGAAMMCVVMRLRQHRAGAGAKAPHAHKLADAARARGIGAGRSGFDPDVARSRLEGGD